jgi:chitinase
MAALAGANVSITYQQAEEAAARVVKKVESYGVKGLAVKADAADEQDMAMAMDTVIMPAVITLMRSQKGSLLKCIRGCLKRIILVVR